MSNPRQKNAILAVLLVAWGALSMAGFVWFTAYKETPGADVTAPRRWPTASAIGLAADRPTLLMFAHPRCPCTGASLEELAHVLAASRSAAHVVFMSPGPNAGPAEATALWRKAKAIDGVRVTLDADGHEMALFGPQASGHTLVYATTGELLFSGGITPSRGHAGDSLGRTRVLALLGGGPVDRPDAPTFGCALRDPNPEMNTR